MSFEIGQIIEDTRGGKSIIIEKNELKVTYFIFFSPKDPEYLFRRFNESPAMMKSCYKLCENGT